MTDFDIDFLPDDDEEPSPEDAALAERYARADAHVHRSWTDAHRSPFVRRALAGELPASVTS